MSVLQAFNTVYFRPGGASGSSPVALTLEHPWKLSAGLKPDINQAIVPFHEYDKIGDANQSGQVEFWFLRDPAAAPPAGGGGAGAAASADVVIANVRIADIDPLALATVRTSTGQTATRFSEYRLSFSDFRDAFVPPRGGRLMYGPINVGPTPTAGTNAPPPVNANNVPATAEYSVLQLVTFCLLAMGLAVPQAGLPATLNQVDAPRDIKWFGNHAPTELEKLLTLSGHVFCPHLDGTFSLEQLTATGSPNIGAPSSASGILPNGTATKIDHRGKYVVITSCPTRPAVTQTVQGPADAGFQFVCQNSTGEWVSINACDLIPSNDPATAFKTKCASVAVKNRATLLSQLYTFIQLSATIAPPVLSPILACRLEADGSTPDILVTANAATADAPSGGLREWSNSPTPVQFVVTTRLLGNILALNAPIQQVTGPTPDRYGGFQALGPTDLSVRFSIERWQPDPGAPGNGQTQPLPEYYLSGWESTVAGTPSQLSDADTQNAITGQMHNVIIIDRPELQLLVVDGEEINRATLDASAAKIAGQYLALGSQTLTVQARVGFSTCQPSGLVASVEWDQEKVTTTVRCNDWFTAASAVGIHDIRKLEGGTGRGQGDSEAHPHESATQSRRSSLGASGNSPRVLPLVPSPTLAGGYATPWGWSTGPLAGVGGAYNGMVLTNPAQAITVGAGFIEISFSAGVGSGSPAAGTACVIIVPAENDSTIASLPSQVLIGLTPMPPMPALSAALGVAATVPIYLAQWDPTAIRSVTYDPIGHKLNDSVFSSPTTPQQKLVTNFVDCQTGT
jgi:hypothetical protein